MPRQSRQSLAARETKSPPPKKRKRVIESSSPSDNSDSIPTAPQPVLDTPKGSKRPKPRDTSPTSRSVFREKMYNFSSPARPADVAGPNAPRRMPRASIVNPRHGAKLIVVKNQRKGQAEAQTEKYYHQVLAQLVPSLDAILRNEDELPTSNEELYQGVRIVCMQGKSADLYRAFSSRMNKHASEAVKPRIYAQLGSTASGGALPCILEEWRVWKSQWARIAPIFQGMTTPPNQTLSDLADDLFRAILGDDLIGPRAFQGVCSIITQGRRGKSMDVDLSARAVQMIIELGLYTKHLEPLILAQTQEFADGWATSHSKENHLRGYVSAVLSLFKSEAERCDQIGLSAATKRELIALLEEHAIKRQLDTLTNDKEVGELLDDNDSSDLEALYSLLKRCALTDALVPSFEKWVKERGTAIVFDDQHQDDMIVLLLTLRKQADNLWRVAFHRNKAFSAGIRNAFIDFMNKTKKSAATHNTENSKQGEMIAKYVDFLLRGGAKVIPSTLSKPAPRKDEEEDNEVRDDNTIMKDQLDQVLDLFRFLEGKAVFEAFYKKDLARRLLLARSASADDEISMLSRLKTECGANFTHNLETMFKDIELSKEEMKIHKDGLTEEESAKSIDLDVNILCLAAWPTYPDVKAILPQGVRQILERFEQGYRERHQGRGLIWKHSLAHCQIKATFPKGRRELIVSGFQALVLMLFNYTELDETISYERIQSETGLDEGDLKRTLQSLACAKLRPLKKHPQGRDIKRTDVFSLNKTFEHSKYRVKINQVQHKETKEENKDMHERLQVDRELEIQAAIVRIMKSEKTLTHTMLVTKVIETTKTRGAVPMGELKKQIEKLIMKDYLERDDDNSYSYVA